MNGRMRSGEKILILVPGKDTIGGISNYYNALRSKFSMNVEYLLRGARNWPNRGGFFKELYRMIRDIYLFSKKLNDENIRIVHTNTSLDTWDMIRDGIFVSIAKWKNKKVIIFFRGWSHSVRQKIGKRYLWLFKFFVDKSDCCIVLSEWEKHQLQEWGYKKQIFVETTLVDDALIENISSEYIISKYRNGNSNINLLFLSRIEKTKGIYEALDTYILLKKGQPYLHFIIAGDGFELENVKNKVKNEDIQDITFKGFVKGEEKIQVFNESHLFLFTSYSEGMPNAVLEAMAFGIPVVTTNVGGLSDFFIDRENGYIVTENVPSVLADKIDSLIIDKELILEIALNNFKLANERFYSSKVVKRLESIYTYLINLN